MNGVLDSYLMSPSLHKVGEASGGDGLGVGRGGVDHVRLLHPHVLATRLSRRPATAREQPVSKGAVSSWEI